MTKKTRSTKSKVKTTSRRKVAPSARATGRKKTKRTQSAARVSSKTRAPSTVKKAKVKKAAVKKKAAKKKVAKKKAAPKKTIRKKARKKAVKKRVAKKKAAKKAVKKRVAPRRPKKKKAAPVVAPAPSPAMKAFERAVNLFHRHKFESAQRAFTQFIERYPQEAEMVVRARSYLAICRRQLSRPPATPRDAEALYDRGIVELNYGRIREAISYFQRALKRDPEAPHILYSLAAAHARLGQLEQALEELKEAVKRREVLRIHARRDADFVNLYAHPEFQQLVGWEVVEESPPLSPSAES